jgi:hypothetical protein
MDFSFPKNSTPIGVYGENPALYPGHELALGVKSTVASGVPSPFKSL